MNDAAERAARTRFLTESARTMLAAGADADDIARELVRRTDSPISAIRALSESTGLGLADAKWVVHRNLAPETRKAAESFWRDLIDAFEQAHERSSGPEPGRPAS
jgi:ribosomal protein L7/L12